MNVRCEMFLALAAAMLVGASPSTASAQITLQFYGVRAQPKLRSGQFSPRSACVMPAEVGLTKLGVKGAEDMTEEGESWGRALQVFVESHLGSAGIAVTQPFDEPSSASNDELRQVLLQIQEKYRATYPQLVKKPKGVDKSLYTLGDQVTLLPCAEKADLLVFVRGAGQVVTKDRAALSFIAGGPIDGATLSVAMADAKTGEIVAFIRHYETGDFLDKSEEDFGESLDSDFAYINLGNARKNAKAAGH